VSGPEGILLRSSAVGYWHGEGSGAAPDPVEIEREPDRSPPQPAVNVLTLPTGPADAHPGCRAATLGRLLGAERLEVTVVDVDPGEGYEPYHYVYGREEWLLVLAGTPALRHPHGEDRLEVGDLVWLPEGPDGARRLLNPGESAVRALLVSTTGVPATICDPDTGQWLLRNELGQDDVVVRELGPPEPPGHK